MTTNIDVKRKQILEERRRRLLNAGVKAEEVDNVIAREDYERLPVEKKLERLEALVVRNAQALANDILTLRNNQALLADAMDTNFEAFARMLAQLGLAPEKQREILEETERAIVLQRKAREEEAAKQQAQAQTAEIEKSVDQPAPEGQPEQLPDGVQVFGG